MSGAMLGCISGGGFGGVMVGEGHDMHKLELQISWIKREREGVVG